MSEVAVPDVRLELEYHIGKTKYNYNNNNYDALAQLSDEDCAREEEKKEKEEGPRKPRAHSVFVEGREEREHARIAHVHLEMEMKS